MARLLAVALLLALLVSGTALAARGDPQRHLRPADQARAKAMLLRKADLPPTFTATPSGPESDAHCKALDESDLTLTGDAESKSFQAGPFVASSIAQVYETVADANASWRRGTSAAGLRCARTLYARELSKGGGTIRSFGRLAFPKVAARTIALRLEARSQGIPVYLDFVALQHSRAHATLLLGGGLAPIPKAEEVRLARVIAARMTKAMRGA